MKRLGWVRNCSFEVGLLSLYKPILYSGHSYLSKRSFYRDKGQLDVFLFIPETSDQLLINLYNSFQRSVVCGLTEREVCELFHPSPIAFWARNKKLCLYSVLLAPDCWVAKYESSQTAGVWLTSPL